MITEYSQVFFTLPYFCTILPVRNKHSQDWRICKPFLVKTSRAQLSLFFFQCCGLWVRIQHFKSILVRIRIQPSNINVDLCGSESTTLIYLVFTMESYLNPVCGVKTEVAEPHGEPPARGMDYSVHTLLIIKIIVQTQNIFLQFLYL